jgi:toxin ParE1/3/4
MKKIQVKWTKTARRDLEEIIEFIAIDNITKAMGVLNRIELKADNLKIFPERGRIVPELREVDVFIYHELVIRPWRIIYRRDKSRLFVLAVLDSRRDLSGLLLERFLR